MNVAMTATDTLNQAQGATTETTATPKPRRTLTVLLCRHKNARWPVKGRQECLDCLATREYEIGGKIGRWKR